MTLISKISLDKYIEFTSVLMVFMQGFVIRNFPIDLKLFYIFLVSNSFLLLIRHGIKIHKNIILIFLAIIFHGLIVYLVYATPMIFLIKQVIGISIAVIYFYNVFRVFDINRLFIIYLKLSIIFCVIALVFFPFGILDTESNRMDGLMSEPSKFIIVSVPALFYFIKEKKLLKALIVFVSFLFAQSSLGYIAIVFTFILLILRKETIKYLGFTIIPLFILFSFLQQNELFQNRFNSTFENLNVFETKSFPSSVNVSTFALLKNAYISVNNVIDHPLGTGIGSFGYRHDFYLDDLEIPKNITKQGIEVLNKEDASSLSLRILSDFGVFGIFVMFLFLYTGISAHFKDYNQDKKVVCIGIFVYFLIKLIRMGHYFPEEMYFFLFLFLYNLPPIKFNLYSSKTAIK